MDGRAKGREDRSENQKDGNGNQKDGRSVENDEKSAEYRFFCRQREAHRPRVGTVLVFHRNPPNHLRFCILILAPA